MQVIFSGKYTPTELPEDKKDRFVYGLAMFSDDGCDVTIKGNRIHQRIGKGQHLPNLGDSFHLLPIVLTPGEPVDITVGYSNTIYVNDPDSPDYPDIDGCTLFLYLIPAAIAVDANRDGTIAFSGETRDVTSRDAPFRFWCNDDNDGLPNSEGEVIGPPSPDHEDGVIQTAGDLEDFARIWVRFDAFRKEISAGTYRIGLKWKGTPEGPSINIYRSTDTNGSDSYLKEDNAALIQISGKDAERIGRVSGATAVILPNTGWVGSSGQNPTRCLLFEASHEGKGQLMLTIQNSDGTPIGDGPGVWLELKNIKKMYVRGNGTTSASSPYSQNPFLGMQTHNGSYDSIEFEQPTGEQDKAVIFVDGIHSPGLTEPKAIKADWYATCETTFKRLWWQGYKGRFAAYKWDVLTPGLPFKFNESEYRAWNFGAGLTQFLNSIQRSHRTIIAHSQGNAVVGAALRSGLTVENYILMQAAVPGGCYDTRDGTVNGYQRFMDAELNNPTPDSTDDLGFRGYLSSLGVTGRVVNFHNGIDYALVTGTSWGLESNWEKCEVDYKPNVPVPYGWSTDGYFYNNQRNLGRRCELHKFSGYAREVSDIRESLSFVARPRSKAVAALGATRGSIQSDTSLRGIPYNFTDDPKEHGGQWSRPIQKAWDVYTSLLDVIDGE